MSRNFKMASSKKRSRRTFTFEEMVELCAQDSNTVQSDIDCDPDGMSSEDEEELDQELLAARNFDLAVR